MYWLLYTFPTIFPDSKLITGYAVTSANVHDSQAPTGLIDEKDKVLYDDSAYSGKDLLASLPETLKLNILEKGTRNCALTDEQKANNKAKSKNVFALNTSSDL